MHLEDFFTVDVKSCVEQFINMLKDSRYQNASETTNTAETADMKDLCVIQDESWRRNRCSVDFNKAVKASARLWCVLENYIPSVLFTLVPYLKTT